MTVMMKQLRPFRDEAVEREVYSRTYDHTRWQEHRNRVMFTAQVIRDYMVAQSALESPYFIADLSAGDQVLALTAARMAGHYIYPKNVRLLTGDIAPGCMLTAPISQSISLLADQSVDMFICSETLEHMQRPDWLLAEIRRVAKHAIISTPAWPDDQPDWSDEANEEHYWQWNTEALSMMLHEAGFTNLEFRLLPEEHYTYQIWTVS